MLLVNTFPVKTLQDIFNAENDENTRCLINNIHVLITDNGWYPHDGGWKANYGYNVSYSVLIITMTVWPINYDKWMEFLY